MEEWASGVQETLISASGSYIEVSRRANIQPADGKETGNFLFDFGKD